MGCSEAVCHSLITTSPSAFISANAAAALMAAMDEGVVTGLMGVRDEVPEYRRMKANIWETVATTDTDPDNDLYLETTTLGADEPPLSLVLGDPAPG